MANSRKSTRKTGNVAQFPPPESGVAVADEPEPIDPTPEATEAASDAAQNPQQSESEVKRGRGRPKATDAPIETDFWKRVKAIPRADWGTRVFLYLYILEPLCNLKQSGGKVYLNRYAEPVQDEHQICMEYGSGRYRLMLAYNKVSPDQSNELARYEFEIYNPQHPPKVPRAAWINDARNAKWEALLPKETPATAATAASTIVDAMKMVSDIRRDVRDEIGEPEEQPRASEMLETMKAAKELFATPAAPAGTPAKDPLEIAVALATTMMQMKADNPVIDMYRDELKALREEMKEERAANRAREQAAPSTQPKGLVDQLTELVALGEKLDLKKLFGFGNGTSEARPGRTTGLDVLRDLVTGPAGERMAQGFATVLMNLPTWFGPSNNPAQRQAPVILSGPNPDGTLPPTENPEQQITRIGNTITRPMLFEFFLKDEHSGQAFAQWMWDAFPKDYAFIRAYGAEDLINRYRRVPEAWPIIAAKEAEFLEFLKAFCAWDPNTDEGATPSGNEDDGVQDLDQAREEATA
jgi:hypothetical protein